MLLNYILVYIFVYQDKEIEKFINRVIILYSNMTNKVTSVSIEIDRMKDLEEKGIGLSPFIRQAHDAFKEGKFDYDYTRAKKEHYRPRISKRV